MADNKRKNAPVKRKPVPVKRKVEPQEDVYYVGVGSPVELRKTILRASSDIIKLLKANEVLKQIRIEKLELTNSFRDEVTELNRLVSRLKRELPKTKLRELPRPSRVADIRVPERKVISRSEALGMIHEGKKPEPKVEIPVKKASSELDRLDDELSDVESKIRALH